MSVRPRLDPAHAPRFVSHPGELRPTSGTRKYSPDQPRDDHGRFGDGGGDTFHDFTSDTHWSDMYDRVVSEAVVRLQPSTPLTEDEIFSVSQYVGAGYEHLNSALRDEGGKGIDAFGEPMDKYDKGRVEDIDSAIAKSPLQENTVLYRGFGDELSTELHAGAVFHDPAFTSTSLSRVTAESFSGSGYVMRIEAPKGTPGLYINDEMAADDGEFEVLLGREQNFTVQSVDEQSKTVNVRASS